MDVTVVESVYVSTFVVIVGFVLLIAFVKHRRRLKTHRNGEPAQPVYHTVGNAFLALQQLAQPEMEHVLETRLEEEQKMEEDDEGGPDRTGQLAAPGSAPDPKQSEQGNPQNREEVPIDAGGIN